LTGKFSVFFIATMRAACRAHLIFLDLIIIMITGEECKYEFFGHYLSSTLNYSLSISFSEVQKFSSEPCPKTLSAYALS
jgi:hypothetical protein